MRSEPTPGIKSHSSFGTVMSERTWSAESSYRYGFNGKEGDDEFSVDEGSYDFGARMYDSRLGRWWSVDIAAFDFPYLSPFIISRNNPVCFLDTDGERIKTSKALKRNADIYPVLKQMKRGNSVYRQLTEKYRKGFKVDLRYDFGTNQTVLEDDGKPALDEKGKPIVNVIPKSLFAGTGRMPDSNGNEDYSTNFNANWLLFDEETHKSEWGLSKAGTVAVIIHEALHSQIDSEGKASGSHSGAWDAGQQLIQKSLEEANLEMNLNLSSNQVIDLSYLGLDNGSLNPQLHGEPFQNYIKKIGGTDDINSDEYKSAYNSWRSRVNNIVLKKN